MRLLRPLLSGLLLLAGTTSSLGQTHPAPSIISESAPAPAEVAPRRILLKAGLNVGRALRWSGYNGFRFQAPLSVGAEYLLSPTFTLYSQLDADVSLHRPVSFSGEHANLVPSGAVGLGGRYYYNQAGRQRHNRAHGPFVGNYLGAEVRTEAYQFYEHSPILLPAFNVVWGMQRKLGRNFLFDFNTGVGLGPTRNQANFGYSTGFTTITTQFNLGLYFGH